METLYVIKIGGNIIDDELKLSSFLRLFASLQGKKILVHGGGKLATKLANGMGIQQQMVEGRRITDAETLKIVTMVYAGYINKNIVAQLQANQCDAIGLSGADGNLILAHKRKHASIDFGFVGDVDMVNVSLIRKLVEENIALVVAPITHDGEGLLLNTNADTIAQEIAKAASKYFATTLIYTFEKEGVLRDIENETSVIPILFPEEYEQLKKGGHIFEGMIPKLDNAFTALAYGVNKVVIGKAEQLKELVIGNSGTTIRHE